MINRQAAAVVRPEQQRDHKTQHAGSHPQSLFAHLPQLLHKVRVAQPAGQVLQEVAQGGSLAWPQILEQGLMVHQRLALQAVIEQGAQVGVDHAKVRPLERLLCISRSSADVLLPREVASSPSHAGSCAHSPCLHACHKAACSSLRSQYSALQLARENTAMNAAHTERMWHATLWHGMARHRQAPGGCS